MKYYSRILIGVVLLAAVFVLASCTSSGKGRDVDSDTGNGSGSGTEKTESGEHGELIRIIYKPGYGDMEGGTYYEIIGKNDDGEYVYVISEQDSASSPVVVTTYAFSEEKMAKLEEYCSMYDLASYSNKRDSDDFALDYSPWNYTLVYDESAYGGSGNATYSFGEYKFYSDQDLERINELRRGMTGLRGEMISQVTEGDDENSEENGENAENAQQIQRLTGKETVAELMEYLAGTWKLYPKGERSYEPYAELTFGAEGDVTYFRLFDGAVCQGTYIIDEYVIDGADRLELMELQFTNIPEDFTPEYENMSLRQTDTQDYMYFYLSDSVLFDRLALYYSGNGGYSYTGDALFNIHNMVLEEEQLLPEDDYPPVNAPWIFVRDREKDTYEWPELRNNTDFFAYFWDTDVYSVELQYMNPLLITDPYGYGTDERRLAFTYDGVPQTVTYNYSPEVSEYVVNSESGQYLGRVYKVFTDENGCIVNLIPTVYLDNGYYDELNAGLVIDGADARGSFFAETDQLFLGYFDSESGEIGLTIEEADPQTGGYQLHFLIWDVGYFDGYANVDGDHLTINQAEDGSGDWLYGEIYSVENGVRLVITESESNLVPAGREYVLTKPAGAQ